MTRNRMSKGVQFATILTLNVISQYPSRPDDPNDLIVAVEEAEETFTPSPELVKDDQGYKGTVKIQI